MIDNQKYSIILPGRIVEYFAEDQTATVQVCAETIYSDATSDNNLRTREPLEDVPVHTPSGGGWAITMPIKAGDTCILFFSQIGYDHWLYEDKDKAGLLAAKPKPWLKRQFSEDDGYALVGLNTIPRAIKSYTTDGSQWRNEDATQNIHLKEDLSIEINSPVSVTINAPAVVVNCETADINATTKTTVNSPKSQFTGDVQVDGTLDVTGATTLASTLDVTGAITGKGGLAVSGGSGASVSGSMAVTGGDLTTDQDVVAGGTSLKQHAHTDSVGGNTSPPN